ncbi:MAG: phosphoribosylglycinamide formyltransferase [Gaiellales bacterium]
MIGVLVSGSGSNLQALLDHDLPIVAVASNVAGVRALQRAEAAAVPSAVFELSRFGSRDERDSAMASWLVEQRVQLVVCAGYMQLLTSAFLERFPGRVINVHPSLLPAFPGMLAVERALEAGVEKTGVTVHYVDDGVDTGEVIEQVEVTIDPHETAEALLDRLHAVEHRLLPSVALRLLEESIGSS